MVVIIKVEQFQNIPFHMQNVMVFDQYYIKISWNIGFEYNEILDLNFMKYWI